MRLAEEVGVSVVICCYNGAKRLPITLAYLAGQQGTGGLKWEVLIVNNASTDDTATVAQESWPMDAPAPLRVICEPAQGVAHARATGIIEARYSIVSFIDDDNWVSPDWVSLTFQIMSEHPEVAVMNGFAEPDFEQPPPAWFPLFKSNYGLSRNEWPMGDVTGLKPALFCAGMALRRKAWMPLQRAGFTPLMRHRHEDTELCLILELAGWRWRREPRLRFTHRIPASRLRWEYCVNLSRDGGAAYEGLALYKLACRPEPVAWIDRQREGWLWAAQWTVRRILARPGVLLRYLLSIRSEGDRACFHMASELGRLRRLITWRSGRARALHALRETEWLKSALEAKVAEPESDLARLA